MLDRIRDWYTHGGRIIPGGRAGLAGLIDRFLPRRDHNRGDLPTSWSAGRRDGRVLQPAPAYVASHARDDRATSRGLRIPRD